MRSPASAFGLLAVVFCAVVLACVPATRAQEDKTNEKPAEQVTPKMVAELAKLFEAEMKKAKDDGLEKRFAPEAFARANNFAKQAALSEKAGRLNDARDGYRKARWAIPALPMGMPDHVARILGDTKMRHGGWVKALAFNKDGSRLATAGDDGIVKIWDAETGRQLLHYTEHQGEVNALVFSHDDKWVASGGIDKDIRIWDAETGKLFKTLAGHKDAVTGLAFSPDNKLLLAGSKENKDKDTPVRLYEVETGKTKHALRGNSKAINCVAYSKDGKHIAAGDEESTVHIWDADKGSDVIKFKKFDEPIGSMAFSPDSKSLLVCGGDKQKYVGKLFSLTGEEKQVYDGHSKDILGCAITPDGKTVATGGGDNTVRLYDTTTAVPFRTLAGHLAQISVLTFAPDSMRLASGSEDGTVRLWDLGSTETSRLLGGEKGAHDGPAWSAYYGKNKIVTAGRDRLVQVWDAETNKLERTFKGHTKDVTHAVFHPDGKHVLSASGDRTMKLWETGSDNEVVTFKGHGKTVICATFNPDGKKVISGSADKTMKVWNTVTGECSQTVEVGSVVSYVAWSPDGKLIAAACGDRTVRLYDADSMKELRVMRDHGGAVLCVSFSTTSDRLVTSGGDMRVHLYDLKLGGPPAEFRGHTHAVSSCAISPDGKLIASAGGDQVIKLWDVNTRQELHSYRGHKNWVNSVAFSPDGQHVVSSSVDKTVRQYELGVQSAGISLGHGRSVRAIASSPDGKHFATASEDSIVRVWDATTGREVHVLAGHDKPVTALSYSADGKTLTSGAEEGHVIAWDVTTGKAKLQYKSKSESQTEYPTLVLRRDNKTVVAWAAGAPTKDNPTPPSGIEKYNLEDGKQVGTTYSVIEKKEVPITALAFNPEGMLAAVGDKSGQVRFIDIDERKVDGVAIKASAKGISDVCFTPDGKRLVTADESGEIAVWDLANRAKAVKTFKASDKQTFAFAMLPDGKRIATAGLDNVVRVWDLETGKELRKWDYKIPYQVHRPFIRGLSFVQDGKALAAANGDSTIWLLDLDGVK